MANQPHGLNVFDYAPLNVMSSDYDMPAQQSLADPTFNEFMDPNFWSEIGDGAIDNENEHEFPAFGLDQLPHSPEQKLADTLQSPALQQPSTYPAELTTPRSHAGIRQQRIPSNASQVLPLESPEITGLAVSKTSSSTENANDKDDGSLGVSAEEDKRRRNTAASARFRVKKKQREQAMEKTAKEMTEKCAMFETRVKELEKENRLLKGLLTEKAGQGKSNGSTGSSDEELPRATKRSKLADVGR